MRISDWSSDVCSSDLLGMRRESENHVTAEELHLIVAEAQSAGVIDESERAMISSVMRLADRPVRGLMTPRTDVDWLDVDADEEEIRARLVETPHTRLPVAEGSVDAIVGVVQARDLVGVLLEDRKSTRLNSSHYCASRMPSSV